MIDVDDGVVSRLPRFRSMGRRSEPGLEGMLQGPLHRLTLNSPGAPFNTRRVDAVAIMIAKVRT